MVEMFPAKTITLLDLIDKFGLPFIEDARFFRE